MSLAVRLEPRVPAGTARNPALEGLRGAAALAVLYAHITTPHVHADQGGSLDPSYAPSPVWWWLEGGTLAVLVFFLLSGHVIGLSLQRPFARHEVPGYLRRRALRLFPIYAIAVVLGWVLSPATPLYDALGHLFFLQSSGPTAMVSLLPANPNLWSLPYEVIFYLAFPLLWWARPPLLLVLALFAGFCVLPKLCSWPPAFPASIAGGAVFWITGLATAWLLPTAAPNEPEHAPWPSLLLLALSTWQLNPLGTLLRRFDLGSLLYEGIEFEHLAALPVLTLLLVVVARRSPPCPRFVALSICWLLPTGTLLWRALRGTFTLELAVPTGLLVLATALCRWHPGLGFWRALAPVGAISYGLYCVGYPAQTFVRTFSPDFSGNFLAWSARAILVLTLSFAAAWWLERCFQPRLRQFFRTS